MLDLKHIFCQASPPSDEQEDQISQTKDQSRQRLGWHAVDLTSVLARAEEYAVRTKEGELGCVPEKYVRQAYQDSETLTFDEVNISYSSYISFVYNAFQVRCLPNLFHHSLFLGFLPIMTWQLNSENRGQWIGMMEMTLR